MSEPSILFLYLQHPFKTETKSSIGTFDNTLIADLLNADVGYPLAKNGDTLSEYSAQKTSSGISNETDVDGNKYRMISSRYHEDFCITNDNVISDEALLTTGETKHLSNYDILMVSHFWAYNPLINYLANNFSNKTIIAIQEGSIQDVLYYSSGLKMEHRKVLENIDGYISENNQYENYVSQFVSNTILVPLPVPKQQFESVELRSKQENKVCIGVATFNIDYSNFYTNILTVDALRNNGYDMEADIIGIMDFQEKMVDSFEGLSFVNILEFIEDDFYEKLSEYKLAILLTQRSTAGRVSAECAGVNVPVIGNYQNDLQSRCFPNLSIEPTRIDKAINLAQRLLDDPLYYSRVVEEGRRTVSSLQNHDELIDLLNRFVREIYVED